MVFTNRFRLLEIIGSDGSGLVKTRENKILSYKQTNHLKHLRTLNSLSPNKPGLFVHTECTLSDTLILHSTSFFEYENNNSRNEKLTKRMCVSSAKLYPRLVVAHGTLAIASVNAYILNATFSYSIKIHIDKKIHVYTIKINQISEYFSQSQLLIYLNLLSSKLSYIYSRCPNCLPSFSFRSNLGAKLAFRLIIIFQKYITQI